MANGEMIEKFYGNTDQVRLLLHRALVQGREQAGFTCAELDGICMFGKDLPSSENFEKDPNLINRQVFCRASFPLGLTADTALESDMRLKEADIPFVVAEMKKYKAGAVASCGGDGKTIPLEDQARVYFVLRVLDELG